MKYLILVLSIIAGLASSGCTHVPTAGVYVTNNVENTLMVIESTRGYVLNPRITTGDKAFVPVSGFPGGNQFTISAKVYAPDGKYLGIAEKPEYISFDASGRYGSTWVVSYYNATSKDRSVPSVIATAPVQAPAAPPVPDPGSIKIMNNIVGVKVVVTSSEDHQPRPPLVTGQDMVLPIGIDPKTEQFTLVAKVYSLTGDYLGYTDYRDSIDLNRGYGNDRIWSIASYTPVRTISKR